MNNPTLPTYLLTYYFNIKGCSSLCFEQGIGKGFHCGEVAVLHAGDDGRIWSWSISLFKIYPWIKYFFKYLCPVIIAIYSICIIRETYTDIVLVMRG